MIIHENRAYFKELRITNKNKVESIFFPPLGIFLFTKLMLFRSPLQEFENPAKENKRIVYVKAEEAKKKNPYHIENDLVTFHTR